MSANNLWIFQTAQVLIVRQWDVKMDWCVLKKSAVLYVNTFECIYKAVLYSGDEMPVNQREGSISSFENKVSSSQYAGDRNNTYTPPDKIQNTHNTTPINTGRTAHWSCVTLAELTLSHAINNKMWTAVHLHCSLVAEPL